MHVEVRRQHRGISLALHLICLRQCLGCLALCTPGWLSHELLGIPSLLPALHGSLGITDTKSLEIQTQILSLVQQVPYLLTHFPCSLQALPETPAHFHFQIEGALTHKTFKYNAVLGFDDYSNPSLLYPV